MRTSRLRAARERRGLSQEELARRTGVPRGTIHEVENLRHTPALDKAATLYHYFDLTLDDALADFGASRSPRGGAKAAG
jgi:transcriptional regulator with XRE-family HTH domain